MADYTPEIGDVVEYNGKITLLLTRRTTKI